MQIIADSYIVSRNRLHYIIYISFSLNKLLGGIIMSTELENYVAIERRLDFIRDQYALEEGHFGSDEMTSPWIPFTEGTWLRHLTFDVRNNYAVNILRIAPGVTLPRHRHRAQVTGYVLKGSWKYAEYDWIAKPGDFIRESPGRTHTLVSEEGMETIFQLGLPLEFLDEDERLIETVDVFWFIDHYLTYCREKNIPVNKSLFL